MTTPEMMWKPIEMAPKDGTEFQAWVINGDGPGYWAPRCRYNEDGVFQIWGRVDYDLDDWDWHPQERPTHWMPHPTPPEGVTHGE